jgi:tetratricopeptide (TPR) repeat protein
MINQEISSYFERIAGYLEQKRLKEAFEVLTFLLSKLQNWQLKERLNDLEDNYKRMLNYLTEGIYDPEREKVFHDILRAVYQVTDIVEFQIRANTDASFFYDRRRLYLYNPSETFEQMLHTLSEVREKIVLLSLLEEPENNNELIQLERQKEQTIRMLFYSILLSDYWSFDTRKKWSKVLNNPQNPLILSCLVITALTLNLLETFDEQKAILLFESAENENEEVKCRALTGIVLFLRKYDKRLYLYPDINNRLQHLSENAVFVKQILHILLQFIFSRDTEKITRRITEEIIPEMLKIGPKFGSKFRWEDWMSESGNNEPNPEWQDLIKKAGIEDKLIEISELQMEGADVMHSSFIHLKNYPFFTEFCNWFLPFTVLSDFLNNKEMRGLSKILSESNMMCNSDKYSFYLTVAMMPDSQRKIALKQLSVELDTVREMLKEESINNSKRINTIVRQYIQDLYRFYKVHPNRKDFTDIFEVKPEFYQVPSIARLIDNKENLSIISEFYFNKNYFEEAAEIYNLLLKKDPDNHVLYQKKGYCLQMQGDIKGALEVYLNAELFNANNSWIIKKLAHCYHLLKQPEEALLYYKKAERLNPDNFSIQLNIGHCYLELKNYDEALKSYFKVEYLDKNKFKAWRPIAWCSFLTGKYEQGRDYFKKIMETNPNATDYLNAGHTQLALGNNKEAIHLYSLSLKHPDNSLEKFMEAFANDIPDIVQSGVKEEDIPFILDRVMYDL